MTTTAERATLPRIVAILGHHDAGEFGGDSCAHCGADCRYQVSFRCDDGTTRRAARGCITLFPQSPLVAEHRKLLTAVEAKRRKGWSLVSWDTDKLAAFARLAAGEIDEAQCRALVDDASRASRDYAARKFGGRR